ncbi:MAG: cupredoxin domain-containing protein [Nitrososphaeraceae archaeon]|jgi:cytochrome c oxidase subunit 2
MYEWVYIAAVVAVLIFVGAASWDVERIIEEVPADAETIKVIGQQWFWSFEHADGTKEVNELHVQKDKPYRFEITSLDVNHAFNVPDWTLLIDAVPGRINTLWNMFTEDGEYLIQCREYCGFSHYNMKAKLFVEPAVTPAAAESPPTTTTSTTNAAAPSATVAPNQQQGQEQQQQQQPSTNATSAAAGGGGGVTLTILEGASVQGSPDYDPDELKVKKGDKITVNNADTMPHTVTNGKSGSDPTSGKLFDTSIINGGDSAEIDTATVDAGAHPYYCMVHPYMTGTLTVE